MPHMRAMTDLFDSIEPRALKMICDDEVAALLSMSACSHGAAAQLIKLESLTITNIRRHSGPVEGLFSSFLVAEVQGPADDSLYPALFVAFTGSQDVETTTNVGCSPNWDEFPAVDGQQRVAVHQGYFAEIKAAYTFLGEKLAEALSNYKFKRLVFCGHSDGGARAQMAVLFTFLEKHVHDWSNTKEVTSGMSEEARMHIKSLYEKASAVCFASPHILGFGTPCSLTCQLTNFMHSRVLNYCWRCDPVPKCSSHDNVKMLQDCLHSASWKTALAHGLGMGHQTLEVLLANHESLQVFNHISKNILFCDAVQCPETWEGGSWSGCTYNLKDHYMDAYYNALIGFKVPDTQTRD